MMSGDRLRGVGIGRGRLVCRRTLLGRGVTDTRLGRGRSTVVFVSTGKSPIEIGTCGSEDRVVGESRSKNRSTRLAIHEDIRLSRHEGLAFGSIASSPKRRQPAIFLSVVKVKWRYNSVGGGSGR
jgi:hypothetical protein